MKELEITDGFATVSGAHRAPNAEVGLARSFASRGKISAVNCVADKTDRTVDHRAVNPAGVVGLSGNNHSRVVVVADMATRGVGRADSSERRINRLAVVPTDPSFSRYRNSRRESVAFAAKVNTRLRIESAEFACVVTGARRENVGAVNGDSTLKRGGVDNGNDTLRVNDCVRGAVNDSGKRRPGLRLESAAGVVGTTCGTVDPTPAFRLNAVVAVAAVIAGTGIVILNLSRVSVRRTLIGVDLDTLVVSSSAPGGRSSVIVSQEKLVSRSLFHVRKDEIAPTITERVACSGGCAVAVLSEGQSVAVRIDVIHRRKSKLLEVVRALHATSRFTSRLNGGKQKTDQDTDDRDDDEQLDEREARTILGVDTHNRILSSEDDKKTPLLRTSLTGRSLH